MIQHIYLGCGPTREATSQKTSYNIYIYGYYYYYYLRNARIITIMMKVILYIIYNNI